MTTKAMLHAFIAGMGSVVPLKVTPPPAEPHRRRSVARHFEKVGARIARNAQREVSAHVAR